MPNKVDILTAALEDNRFVARNITTLMTMTASTIEECRGLLISVGARGITSRDGVERWGLISRNPISRPRIDDDDEGEI